MQLQDLKLWQRELALANAGYLQDAPQPSLCIVWEDPADLDAPAKITTPSPQWLKMATLGHVLPYVQSYHAVVLELETLNGRTMRVPYLDAQEVRREYGVRSERVVHYPVHEAAVLPPMSEEEAIEYILRKDTPGRVWGQSHNRSYHVITQRRLIPQNRLVRNAWCLGDEDEPVRTDMKSARRLMKQRVANEYKRRRDELTKDLDVAMFLERDVRSELDQLQSMDLMRIARDMDKAQTVEQLEALYPWGDDAKQGS
jgi:hypothetical protein